MHPTSTDTQDHSPADLDVMLTEAEAAALTRLSGRTLQRLAEVGTGPRRVQLTERRIGYWKRDVITWLLARTKPQKHEAEQAA